MRARVALRDGVRPVGDDRDVDAYRERVEAAYEGAATERERDRREFVDRLATGGDSDRGDTLSACADVSRA